MERRMGGITRVFEEKKGVEKRSKHNKKRKM